METVAEEKPVASATSRIVTNRRFPSGFFMRAPGEPHHRSRALRIAIRNRAESFLGRHFKRKLLPEALRLPDPKRDSRRHPDRPHNNCRTAQVDPQPETDQESKHWRYQKTQLLLRRAHIVTKECRHTHAHERDERPEIQH